MCPIYLMISALYKMFVCLFNLIYFIPYFLCYTSFLTYFFPDLSSPTTIDPFRRPEVVGATKPGFSCFMLILCCSARTGFGAVMHVLISTLYCLFVCLPNLHPPFFPYFLLMLSFLLIYFLNHLLSDLSIYSFQNKPVPFPGRRSQEATKPGFGFFVLILCCGIFCYRCMFALVVFVFVFQY